MYIRYIYITRTILFVTYTLFTHEYMILYILYCILDDVPLVISCRRLFCYRNSKLYITYTHHIHVYMTHYIHVYTTLCVWYCILHDVIYYTYYTISYCHTLYYSITLHIVLCITYSHYIHVYMLHCMHDTVYYMMYHYILQGCEERCM